ncbi:hypothetical protein M0805_008585 [Coniferiporia weirii]|nr:hypothetical protein M0805_008585 [Coniferiporia weirii]
MSAASTARPKPRPRPRPRIATASTESVGGAQPASATDAAAGSSKSAIEDEDDMFIRNKNRNAKGWKTMNQAVKKTEESRTSPVKGSSSNSSDSDSDLAEFTSPRSKKNRAFKSKVKALPRWAKTGGLTNDDDDDDNDDVFLVGSAEGSGTEKTPKGKRKRDRSRSLSLTPPPPVPIEDVLNTRALVSRVLGISSTSRQHLPPIVIDSDSDGIEELDPELARIAARVKTRAADTASRASAGPSNSAMVDLRVRILSNQLGEPDKVKITSYRLGRNESFSQLLNQFAAQVGAATSEVVITYNGKKVFATSTPATLSIWSEAELEICTEYVYRFMKEQERLRRLAGSTEGGTGAQDSEVGAGVRTESGVNPAQAHASTESGAESDASHDRSDTFRLHLRSDAETITVTVRPTTKCRAIVASFLRKTGRPAAAAKKARIEVDGIKLATDSEIGTADLEDGDLIDIVGL